MIRGFRDLEVWQRAMSLVEHVYSVSERLPHAETYGLASHIRRAAISIPSNIAEGKAVGGKNYQRHIKIALGSEAELQTQIELAQRLKLISGVDCDNLLKHTSEVGRMLVALLKALPRD